MGGDHWRRWVVGAVIVAIFSHRGFQVTASNGRLQEGRLSSPAHARARSSSATSSPHPQKPLQKARCADAVGSVGWITLTNVLATTRHGGAVAACGWASGMDLPISVAPFILCGASLFGIESVMSPIADWRTAWGRLASVLDREKLAAMTSDRAGRAAARGIVEGRVRGRNCG
jgi:acrylyl-CoA reductase (NADPH)